MRINVAKKKKVKLKKLFKFTENDVGGWTFECQHGEDECFGNKVQACILNQVSFPPIE